MFDVSIISEKRPFGYGLYLLINETRFTVFEGLLKSQEEKEHYSLKATAFQRADKCHVTNSSVRRIVG